MRWLYSSMGGALLVLLCMGAQAQVPIRKVLPEPVIPGGSLARQFRLPVLEKPGDFNKHHIRVLGIRDQRGDIVGLKICGHSHPTVCKQTTDIAIALAKGLKRRGATFGPIYNNPEGNGYYVGYGIFEGPINRKYRREYEQAYTDLQNLSRRNPGKLEVTEIAEAEYRRILKNLKHFENLTEENPGQDFAVFHQLPENFIYFYPVDEIAPADYLKLFNTVRASTGKDYLAELQQDEKALQSASQNIRALVYPFEFQVQFEPYAERAPSYPTDQAATEHFNQLIDEAYARDSFQAALAANDDRIEALKTLAQKMNDPYLQQVIDLYAKRSRDFFSLDSLRKNLLEKLPKQERQARSPITEVRIRFRELENDPLADLLETYLINQRTYVQFAYKLDEQHPYLLTDAVIRGWPAISTEQHKALFTEGSALRKPAEMYSNYHFVAPDGTGGKGAHSYLSVSGVVAQLYVEGSYQYINLEDYLQDELQVPPLVELYLAQVEAGLLDSSSKALIIDHYTDTPPELLTVADVLEAGPDFGDFSPSLFSQPPDTQQTQLTEALGESLTPLDPEAVCGPDWISARHYVSLSNRSPFRSNAIEIISHAARRLALDPRTTAETGLPLRVPPQVLVTKRQENWLPMEVWQLKGTPSGNPPRTNVAPLTRASSPATYVEPWMKFQLYSARRLQELPSADLLNAGKQQYQNAFTGFGKSLGRRFGQNEEQWSRDLQDAFGFLRDLTNSVAERAEEGSVVFALEPDPRRWLIDGDGTALLMDFEEAAAMEDAAFVAQVLLGMAELQHGSRNAVTPAQLKKLYQQLRMELERTNFLDSRRLQTAHFNATAAVGILMAASRLSRHRSRYAPNAAAQQALDRRIVNLYQPVLRFFLQQPKTLSDEQEFIFRNLNSALEALKDQAVIG